MESTRRFWSVAFAFGSTAGVAVLFSNPVLLGVPAGIGLWLLGHGIAFSYAVRRLLASDPAAITQSLTDGTTVVGESSSLVVRVADEEGHAAGLETELDVLIPPALVAGAERTYRISEPGTTEIEIPLRGPIAGSFEIQPARLRVRDGWGLFRETASVGEGCSLVVEPRVPGDIEIRSEGQRIGIVRGEHSAITGVAGCDPGAPRKYTPGDPMWWIDWNATARFAKPYVREPESEAARRTLLFIDRRERMRDGPSGRTKLDYAREIGLAIAADARGNGDPIGVSFVDPGSKAPPRSVGSSSEHHGRVRRRLYDVTTGSDPVSGDGGLPGQAPEADGDALEARRDAHRRVSALEDGDAFARTLAPFFEGMDVYTERLTEWELFGSVESCLRERGSDSWLIVVTDDSNREELLKTARAAAIRDIELSLFVLPSALFAERDATEVEAVAEEYSDFQSFVSELDKNNGVTVFEAGPQRRSTVGTPQPAVGVGR